jgi:[acyl-carrier-protein] S-malonyltransferase
VAVSLAQLELLRTNFGVDYSAAQFGFGYSLGEVTAVVAGGVVSMEEALRIPLELSADCVELSRDTTLAVLFSRTAEISPARVDQACQSLNEDRNGVIGVSSVLSPNSLLILGQGSTVDRFAQRMDRLSTGRLYLRKNEHRWPPLHTPIVWQRNIPCRSRVRLHSITIQHRSPQPPVFSLVSGELGYVQEDLRSLLGDWIDHPQQLWSAVEYVLAKGVTDVMHVGPEPNIIPATFDRLAQNVAVQVRSSGRIKALSQIARRPWLQRLLPRKTNLLRAPLLRQFHLEDWLLAQ